MTEYHLQKRGLATWQYITWYDNIEQAKRNFNNVSKGDTGYSWRLVEVIVIEERLLSDQKEAEPDEDIYVPNKNTVTIPAEDWRKADMGVKPARKVVQPVIDPWATRAALDLNKPASEPAIKPDHGLTGSVWVGNPKTKEKRRVVGFEAQKLLAEGWIKAGPRTML